MEKSIKNGALGPSSFEPVEGISPSIPKGFVRNEVRSFRGRLSEFANLRRKDAPPCGDHRCGGKHAAVRPIPRQAGGEAEDRVAGGAVINHGTEEKEREGGERK